MADGQWDSVSTLSVVIDGNLQAGNIFANSLNMVQVIVTIQPTDKNSNKVHVDLGHVLANTWLIDYTTQSKLSWKGSSGWCYTDSPNEFTAIPAGGRSAEAMAGDDGVQQVTFYVYCSPGSSTNKAIGVLVRTDTGKNIYSSQNGQFHNSVSFATLPAFTYKKGDANWTHELMEKQDYYEMLYVYNYYLSCAKDRFYFAKFDVHYYCRDAGYEGFIGWDLWEQASDFRGAYVWADVPHTQASKTIVNFPGNSSEQVTIYNKDDLTNTRSLCFTWVYKARETFWYLPNGPMTADWQYYHTWVVAYDQYGNSGTFWPDTKNIAHGDIDLPNRGTVTATETSPGLLTVSGDQNTPEAQPASAPSPSGGPILDRWDPKLDMYDYNPNP